MAIFFQKPPNPPIAEQGWRGGSLVLQQCPAQNCNQVRLEPSQHRAVLQKTRNAGIWNLIKLR